MLLYRVFLSDDTAREGESGSATYLHRPQGKGRWDNDHLYGAWYFATSAEGAIGETFGNYPQWTSGMFDPLPTGLRRALAVFSAPDDLSISDFDDPPRLQQLNMRPSQVVIRNSAYTQGKAADVFNERRANGARMWAGLRWWSFHRPFWTNLMLWQAPGEDEPMHLEDVQELSLTHTAVIEAARTLVRPLP